MEVINMKKSTIERLMVKLENICMCLMHELEFIEREGHTSGNYTKEDVRRINNWISALARDKFVGNNTQPLVQFLCASGMTMCAQLLEILNNEEV